MTQLGPQITHKSMKIEMDASENLKNRKKTSFLTLQKNIKKKDSKKHPNLAPTTYYLCQIDLNFLHPLPQTPSPRGLTAGVQRKGAHARFP